MENVKYFVSYTREDSQLVLNLAKKLREVGVNLWIDQLDIIGGEFWDHAIEEALKKCHGVNSNSNSNSYGKVNFVKMNLFS